MRRDMAKVLCERPRGGARFKRRSRYRGPIEDAPSFEPTSRNRGGSKWLSEHLGPLRRWLVSQTGRHWDDVYSELRSRISPNNAVQMHIWQHADQYVGREIVMIKGHPHSARHVYSRELRALYHRWTPVYVCPKTGVLKATPARARKRRRRSTSTDDAS